MKAFSASEAQRVLAMDPIIPELIVRSILANPGSSISQIQKRVDDAGIQQSDTDEVDAIFDWFHRRGDIYYARASFVWPVPLALISFQASETTARYVTSGSVTRTEARRLSAPVQPHEMLNSGPSLLGYWYEWEGPILEKPLHRGVPVLSLESIERDLDQTDALAVPPVGNTDRVGFPGGRWEVFGPQGWDVKAQDGRLHRWNSDEEERTVRRYFVQCVDGRLLEIPWDEASLWRFRLGQDVVRSHASDEEVVLGHPLPQSYGLWLAGLGGEYVGRESPSLYRYFIPEHHAERAVAILNSNLGANIRRLQG